MESVENPKSPDIIRIISNFETLNQREKSKKPVEKRSGFFDIKDRSQTKQAIKKYAECGKERYGKEVLKNQNKLKKGDKKQGLK